MIVYKVCRMELTKNRNKYIWVSAFVGRYEKNNPLKMQYALKKTIIAPVGRLFVFDTLKNARNFKQGQGLSIIFECETPKAYKLHRRMYQNSDKINELARIWWRGIKADGSVCDCRMPPEGTLTCKTLKVLRKVKED